MKIKQTWLLIPAITIIIIPVCTFSENLENAGYKYSIKAKCSPEKMMIEGSYIATIPVADSAMTRRIEIFAPEKPEREKTYYLLSSVEYNQDPLRYKTNRIWIDLHKIIMDGREIDPAGLKRENKTILIEFEEFKTLHSEIEIEIDYIMHMRSKRSNLVLSAVWFPMIAPPGRHRNGFELPNVFEYELTLPKEYKLITSGRIVNAISTGKNTKHHVHDANIHFPIWMAGKDFKLEGESSYPIKYSIWSAGKDYPGGSIERIEEQINELYDIFGEPVGENQNLNIILSPAFFSFQMGDVFGSNWGNLVVLNEFFFNKSFFRSTFPALIGHELLHYWWINRIHGNISTDDHLFHECFVEHMTRFYDQLMVKEKPSSLIDRLAGKLTRTDYGHTIANARSGYHYSVLNDSSNAGYLEKIEKGICILQTISSMDHREVWNRRIIEYYQSVRDGNPCTFDRFYDLNPDIAPIIKKWFTENVNFDYAIEKIINRKDGDNVTSGAILRNRGGISLPVPVKFEYEGGKSILDTALSYQDPDTILLKSESNLERVTIDPEYSFPDYNRSNNRNFTEIGVGFLPNSSNMKEDYRISIFPIPIPGYSELTGWSLGTMPFSIMGIKEKSWISEIEKQMHLSPVVGYNFKADKVVWSTEYNQPLNFPTEYSALKLKVDDNPESLVYSMEFQSNVVQNRFKPPLQIISLGGGYNNLRDPEYRSRANWTTGENIIFEGRYDYKNINSFSYPAEGYRFNVRMHKSFKSLGSEWNYERLSASGEYYRMLPFLTVFASRFFGGNIWGVAPYQERFDLVRNALFATAQRYEFTAQSMFSFNFELRLRKRLPFLDLIIYSRNCWIKDYKDSEFLPGNEIGIGLCNTKYMLNFDFSLWRKFPEMDGERIFGFQFSFGRRFDYTDRRWYSR